MKLLGVFMQQFLGGISPGMLAAGFVFALLGVALSLLLNTTKRDPLAARTPVEFSWSFFWSDNSVRIYRSAATALIVIFLSLRFSKELIGSELTMLYSFGIGFGLDKAIEKLRTKTK
jgi:hypothetical protein